MLSTFWRFVMGLLFVLVIFLNGGVMLYVCLWGPSELVLIVFGLRPIIILIAETGSISCVL